MQDLTAIEQQEADELRERQRLRRAEAAAKAAEEEAARKAAAVKALPKAADIAPAINKAVLDGTELLTKWEEQGVKRGGKIWTEKPRVPAVRLYEGSVVAEANELIRTLIANRLRVNWTKAFARKRPRTVLAYLESLESADGTMTANAEKALSYCIRSARIRTANEKVRGRPAKGEVNGVAI